VPPSRKCPPSFGAARRLWASSPVPDCPRKSLIGINTIEKLHIALVLSLSLSNNVPIGPRRGPAGSRTPCPEARPMHAPTHSPDQSSSLVRMPAKIALPSRAPCASPWVLIHERLSLSITVDSCRSAHLNVNRCQSRSYIHRHSTAKSGNRARSDFQTSNAESFHAAVKRPHLVAVTPWCSTRSESNRAWGVRLQRPTCWFPLQHLPPPRPMSVNADRCWSIRVFPRHSASMTPAK
jgi:hypothetical protein